MQWSMVGLSVFSSLRFEKAAVISGTRLGSLTEYDGGEDSSDDLE